MGTPSTFSQLFTSNHLAYLPGPFQKSKHKPRPTTLGCTPPSPLPASTTTPSNPISTVGPSPFVPISLSNSTTANVISSPTKTPAALSSAAAKSGPSSSTTNAAAAPSPLTPKVPPTSDSGGTCSGDGRCDGTGGTSACSGCPTFNSILALSPRMEPENIAAANAALAADAADLHAAPAAVIDPDLTTARMESDASGSPGEAKADQPKKKRTRRGAKAQGSGTADNDDDMVVDGEDEEDTRESAQQTQREIKKRGVDGWVESGRSSSPQHRAPPRNQDYSRTGGGGSEASEGLPTFHGSAHGLSQYYPSTPPAVMSTSYKDLDLERHYVEWTELKRKWEEMMQRTDQWMADVKQTLDEMRGLVAQQSTPLPPPHSLQQQPQPSSAPATATAAGSPKRPQASTASSSPQLQPIEDATVVPDIPPNRGERERNVIWPVVDATSVHD